MIFFEVLNWIACTLTIVGTFETARQHPNLLRLNLCYFLSCVLLIYLMIVYQNWAMVSMYIILMGFSLRGIWVQKLRNTRLTINRTGITIWHLNFVEGKMSNVYPIVWEIANHWMFPLFFIRLLRHFKRGK